MAINNLVDALFGWASIVGATGAALAATAPTGTPARTGAGVYTFTLPSDQGIDATQCIGLVTARGATYGVGTVTHTSDTVKTIRMFDAAGAAADVDFDLVLIKVNA